MRIAIVGGTGTLGSHVTEELRARGHEVRVLSRRSPEHPVDLTTGAGLAAALVGCEVVVDAANSRSAKGAERTLVDGTRHLLAAERAAGVGHHVCVSIVGCDRVPVGYYAVKTAQERAVAEGPVPWTVVRITQFHELIGEAFAALGRWRLLTVPKARLQTIAAVDAARAVADVVERPARLGRTEAAARRRPTPANSPAPGGPSPAATSCNCPCRCPVPSAGPCAPAASPRTGPTPAARRPSPTGWRVPPPPPPPHPTARPPGDHPAPREGGESPRGRSGPDRGSPLARPSLLRHDP
ncbi:NAD(P)H-binding protein [Kitasatospora arboriphila]